MIDAALTEADGGRDDSTLADDAASLMWRQRTGALDEPRVRLAATCGHAPSSIVLGREIGPGDALDAIARDLLARDVPSLVAGLLVASVRACVTLGLDVDLGRDGPELVETVDAWVACPCPLHGGPCRGGLQRLLGRLGYGRPRAKPVVLMALINAALVPGASAVGVVIHGELSAHQLDLTGAAHGARAALIAWALRPPGVGFARFLAPAPGP